MSLKNAFLSESEKRRRKKKKGLALACYVAGEVQGCFLLRLFLIRFMFEVSPLGNDRQSDT